MKQTKLVEITDIEKQKAILEEAGQIIRDGGLVVFPTETVYGCLIYTSDAADD